MGQVIGIHAYAVAADQAGAEWQEIPFGAGRFQYRLGIYANFVENKRQVIDQRDIDVPLRVFDDFCRFGPANRRRLVRASQNAPENGRASGRGSGGQYVWGSVVEGT